MNVKGAISTSGSSYCIATTTMTLKVTQYGQNIIKLMKIELQDNTRGLNPKNKAVAVHSSRVLDGTIWSFIITAPCHLGKKSPSGKGVLTHFDYLQKKYKTRVGDQRRINRVYKLKSVTEFDSVCARCNCRLMLFNIHATSSRCHGRGLREE